MKKTGTLSEPFFVFLKMWLKAHICGIDIKYARQAAVA
jgi:hemerythrin